MCCEWVENAKDLWWAMCVLIKSITSQYSANTIDLFVEDSFSGYMFKTNEYNLNIVPIIYLPHQSTLLLCAFA